MGEAFWRLLPRPRRAFGARPATGGSNARIRSARPGRKTDPAAGGFQQEGPHQVAQRVSGNVPEGRGQPRKILGRAIENAQLVPAAKESPGMESAAREMVYRRKAQRLLQLPRPPSGTERE